MSNLEQHFADPGTVAGDRRPINTDPREQPQWPPATMSMPGMAQPPQQQVHSLRWLGISVILLVVIFGGLFSVRLLLTHTITTTKTFTMGNQPALALIAHSSDIHISSGASKQMTVVTRQQTFVGNNNTAPVHYAQSADRNMVTVTVDEQNPAPFGFGINPSLDFEVTVPPQTELRVQVSSGDITAEGVGGPMSLTASSGDITTDGGSGQVTLTTSSGDITASNISGQLTLSTRSGDVKAIDAAASGNSSFETSSGAITYEGTLADGGSYGFHTGSGDIDLTLPGNAIFHIEASTQSGDISSDFPGVAIQRINSGGLANGSTGQPPAGATIAQISAHTNSGDIDLRRG